MQYAIVADSCCDLTPELKERFSVVTIPLTMTLGEKTFTDDETLDLARFMEELKACRERVGSAAPAPGLYMDAFLKAPDSFAVTISSKLSGSYNSAMLGRSLAGEAGANAHVFDSQSASAGEALLILRLHKFICEGLPKPEIVERIERFVREMRTFFVLDNVDTLMKNGRLSRIAGKLVTALHIRPILGSDGGGSISLFSHAQGWKQALRKLADTIEESGKPTEGESIVISHCNNPSFAEQLRRDVEARYRFREILVLPTRGLSSVYANEMGVIVAF